MQINEIESTSEEIQYIISTPPAWLVRWGLTGFLGILCLVLYLSYLIEYPQTVQASFRLTSTDAPKAIQSKIESRLMRLLVKDGEKVQKDQVLAYLESNAEASQILTLGQYTDSLYRIIAGNAPENLTNTAIPAFSNLGELQRDFQTFAQVATQFSAFLSQAFYVQKRSLLQKDLKDLEALYQNLLTQQSIQQQEYELARQENMIQNQLATQKVIAPLELKREDAKLLAKKLPLQNIESALIQNQSAQTNKQKEILELAQLVSEQKNTFIQAIQTLKSAIDDWEKKYLIKSPLAGKIRFAGFLQEKQTVTANQTLFFVENQSQHYYGEANIPQYNFGKIKVGQKVLIKFASYPFAEYGLVIGKIDFIAEIPQNDSIFLAKVILTNGLNTNYQQKITFKPHLKATAEIITQNRRLIEVPLQELRKILW